MDTDFVIHAYSLEQAIEDGVLTPIFTNRTDVLSGGKPIVATAAIIERFTGSALIEIWNEYVEWRTNVMDTLPEEDQMFVTTMNGEKIWVIEDGAAFTILRPEDY